MRKRTDNKGRKLKEGESQRKDGMYQFRYTDSEGNWKVLYSWKLMTQDKVPIGKKDGKCLRELELEIVKELSPLKKISSPKTVLQCVEEFLSMRTDYAMNTRVGYETDLRAYIKLSCLSNMLVTKVSKSDILEFYSYLAEKKKLGFSAIKRNHMLLNSVFKVAIKDGIITWNPCDKCLCEYRNCFHSRISLTMQEQHILLEYLKDSSNYYSKHYETVAVLLGTGLRISEFIGLTWDEIDLERQCIRLRHQLLYNEEKRSHFLASLKNGTNRIIPLPSVLVKIFQKRFKEKSVEQEIMVDGVSGFIFLNEDGKLHHIRNLNDTFHRMITRFNKNSKDSKLPDLSAHVFRHTYCTRLVELGVDLKVVQEIMGHSTAKVTLDIYTHLNKRQVDSEIYRVEEIDLGE